MKLRLVPIIATLLFTQVVEAEIYKWVDANGKVHYSDKPNSAKSEKLKRVDTKNEVQSSVSRVKDSQTGSDVNFGKNAAYCADLVRQVEYNQQGGSMIVVTKQADTGTLSYKEATQDVRKKNLDILQSDFNKYCK